MSVNRELPHVLVLPEDDANRQIANGFQLALDWQHERRLQVLAPAGGWNRVFDAFESDHIREMERNSNRFMVLLIDFDGDAGRLQRSKGRIPPHLAERVLVLGAWTEPEKLKNAGLGTYEEIGAKLANDCRDESNTIWSHELLRHNAGELNRLSAQVRSILF